MVPGRRGRHVDVAARSVRVQRRNQTTEEVAADADAPQAGRHEQVVAAPPGDAGFRVPRHAHEREPELYRAKRVGLADAREPQVAPVRVDPLRGAVAADEAWRRGMAFPPPERGEAV